MVTKTRPLLSKNAALIGDSGWVLGLPLSLPKPPLPSCEWATCRGCWLRAPPA